MQASQGELASIRDQFYISLVNTSRALMLRRQCLSERGNMLRQQKPFITEFKGGSRNRTKPLQAFDPDDMFANDERKPVDISSETVAEDDSYESALRAADSLFGPKRTVTETVQHKDQRRQHAESFFSKPVEQTSSNAPEPEAPKEPERRILADLSAKDELAERLANVPRRGRKPGTKNKPKIDLPAEQLPASDLRLHAPLSRAAITIRTKVILTDHLRLVFVGDLVQLTEANLRQNSFVGMRTIKEVVDFLALHGLSLNTSVTNWPPEGLQVEVEEVTTASAPVIEPESEPEIAEKKSRGRPVGSKNKPKLTIVATPQPVRPPPIPIRPIPAIPVSPSPAEIAAVRQMLAASRPSFLKRQKPGEQWRTRRRLRY